MDNNGFISLEEAGAILDKPPFNFPSDKIQVLLKSFDKDGNGQLDIEEFAGFYTEAKAMYVVMWALVYLLSFIVDLRSMRAQTEKN